MKDREMIESITAADVYGFMAANWVRYCSSSRLGLRLDFNGLGAFQVVKNGEVVWQGADVDEAIAQLKNAI